MKKLVFVYIGLIIAVALLAIMRSGGNISIPFGRSAEAQVGDKKINLILAKSDKDRIRGLSGRKNLEADRGMLFVFEKKDQYSFWMKEVNFPLDIIFIDANTVVDLFENVPPANNPANLTIYKPSQPANFVLELNAGQAKKLNIKKGSKITFKNI